MKVLRTARMAALTLVFSLSLTAAPGAWSEADAAGNRVRTAVKATKPLVRLHRFGVASGAADHSTRQVRISRGRHIAPALGRALVIRYGKHGKHHRHGVRIHFPHFAAFALPEQTLYPPYYRSNQSWTHRPDMDQRIKRGLTVRQGSPWRGHIQGGKTVEQGAVLRGHMKGGRTARQGSPLRSHLVAGRTVRQGSPWASTMPNWTFGGYRSPMRPRGIPYYRTR